MCCVCAPIFRQISGALPDPAESAPESLFSRYVCRFAPECAALRQGVSLRRPAVGGSLCSGATGRFHTVRTCVPVRADMYRRLDRGFRILTVLSARTGRCRVGQGKQLARRHICIGFGCRTAPPIAENRAPGTASAADTCIAPFLQKSSLTAAHSVVHERQTGSA